MSDYLSFRLGKEFVDGYRDREVPWGFRDAAGTPVSEIVFFRTYSRIKEDGNKETWVDVCERVINGMISLQKDHAKTNKLPWNDRKAHATAEEAFDRMFHFKWTPPGRGLWMMGTELVNKHRNSAALMNCFAGDETFITRDGVRSFEETVGSYVDVWAHGWHKAEVKSFGRQMTQEVTFAPAMRAGSTGWRAARSNHRVTVTVTPDHRWELVNGRTTTDLRVGDFVPSDCVVEDFNEEAFIHGLVFGDGWNNYRHENGDYGLQLRLCGEKSRFVDLFDHPTYPPSCNGDPLVYLRRSYNMKDLPENPTPEYASSFLSGWFAADGHGNTLDTQNQEAAEWVEKYAAIAGYVVTGYTVENQNTNLGERKNPLHRIKTSFSGSRSWKVVDIRYKGEQEVFCAVVPGVERFTLSSGIKTSNCGFVSTADIHKNDPGEVFAWLMESSMLGIGVGFDTKGSEKGIRIHNPVNNNGDEWVVPDSREGWVESTRMLINSYLKPDQGEVYFDYSQIRPAGSPIKTFGGTAAGPEPLMRLHDKLQSIFIAREGKLLDSLTIMDIANLIGVCVVSGNVRRSAELAMGSLDDPAFLDAKNYEAFPGRAEHGWMSNNSVEARVGDDLSGIVDNIALNGEPGVIWMDVTRDYGRLVDPPNHADYRAAGYNPCAEQSLESFELCNLVEVYLNRHDSKEDFLRTLKFAYMFAKTSTLVPTHWDKTNAIMQRNRRIGTSVSGVANFVDNNSLPELRSWLDAGYREVRDRDRTYSEWLCVRESIKTTTVKPSGTVSLLAGESPGVHWAPGAEYHLRGIVFQKDDPMVQLFRDAGYEIQESAYTPETSVFVQFAIHSLAKRTEKDVTIFEKIHLASELQQWWSDNSVSVTVSFDAKHEAEYVSTVLSMYEGKLKTVSFLPIGNETYQQMPYQSIDAAKYEDQADSLLKVDLSSVYTSGDAKEAEGEKYCSTDKCEIPQP